MSTDPRILIAEDKAVVAEELKQTLVDLGYSVAGTVRPGDEVAVVAARVRPDLILVGLSVEARKEGVTIGEQVSARLDIPVIFLFSCPDEAKPRDFESTFARLSLPIDPARLHSAIQVALWKHDLESRLKESENRCRTIFNMIDDAMMVVEGDGTISMVNRGFELLSGFSAEEVVNTKRWHEFLGGIDLDGIRESLAQSGTTGASALPRYKTQFFDRGRCAKNVITIMGPISGTRRCVVSMSDTTVLTKVGIHMLNVELMKMNTNLMREVTGRRAIEKQLMYQANHDSLTGLPNRNLLFDRLKQSFAFADRQNTSIALLLLDLDKFKACNDTMGHHAGDIVLKEVAKRLQDCTRRVDTVARFGGDEFVIIVNELRDVHDIVGFAEKVLGQFSPPIDVHGEPVNMTASIGIAVYPLHGTDADTLIKMADTAMYQAKQEERNAFRFYAGTLGLRDEEMTATKDKLRTALERGEFVPHYQPRIDVASGSIAGVEALIRWQPSEASLVYPEQLIPLLEESGLVVPVEEWLLEKVCRQAKAWQEEGFPPIRVSVNVSERQFRQMNFPERVEAALTASGLDPRYLGIELSEKVMTSRFEEGVEKLQKLKSLGVRLSIDNFGTGYFSLSRLNRLPVDELMIDRSVVNGITTEPNDAMIVSAAIAMGHSLGRRLVAEGVESEGQYAFLARHRCEEMQGYFFSRPLPAEEVEGLMRMERPLTPTVH